MLSDPTLEAAIRKYAVEKDIHVLVRLASLTRLAEVISEVRGEVRTENEAGFDEVGEPHDPLVERVEKLEKWVEVQREEASHQDKVTCLEEDVEKLENWVEKTAEDNLGPRLTKLEGRGEQMEVGMGNVRRRTTELEGQLTARGRHILECVAQVAKQQTQINALKEKANG